MDGQGGDTERRILAAARKEFIAKGLDGARMQAIAAEAGVNKALLHYYHRSKDRLYRTVVLDTLQNVWGNIGAHFRAHGPADGLEPMVRTLVSTYIRTLAANPEFPLFMLREMAMGGATFQAVLKEAGMPVGDVPMRVMAALQAEIKAGHVKPIHPLHFLMNVMGMCVATFITRPVVEKMGPAFGITVAFDEAFFEERIRVIVDMAMNGIRTRREA
jgi:TetR/AcrR family transcriptional regulator